MKTKPLNPVHYTHRTRSRPLQIIIADERTEEHLSVCAPPYEPPPRGESIFSRIYVRHVRTYDVSPSVSPSVHVRHVIRYPRRTPKRSLGTIRFYDNYHAGRIIKVNKAHTVVRGIRTFLYCPANRPVFLFSLLFPVNV